MARKRRPAEATPPPSLAPAAGSPAGPEAAGAAGSASPALPQEVVRGDWTVPVVAATLLLAPALGVPHEEMLQDTLKSIIVSTGVLGAALLFFLHQHNRREPLRWHGIAWLPLMLLAHALGSMAWSHTYLGGVEAVRWFVFSLLLWLGLNTFDRERLPWLAWGIHGGALVAALWAALQFWGDLKLFPQGPNPASTFVNRNFFAEFVVSTLPFGFILIARARTSASAVLLVLSSAFIVTTILMTGTRAALIALWLQLLVVLPLIGWRCRGELPWREWSRTLRLAMPLVFVAAVLAMAAIPSGNPEILGEERGTNALQRAVGRTQSIGPDDPSLNVRMTMWRATLNMVRQNPLSGVGAGAWESEIPLYQAEGSQLETDYYAHNEFLQLVAEYGLIGWIFLALLVAYLLRTAWFAWRAATPQARAERPWQAVFLCSLLAFSIVSNIGFPWRMASTGALFAVALAALAAADARLGQRRRLLAGSVRWTPLAAQATIAGAVAAIGLALFITYRAAESERRIVQATKIALTISASPNPNDPRWQDLKRQMLRLAAEGIALNPHYRKITPMVADELAKWGDWANALWIWESVLSSRPNVVAILSNVARAESELGRREKALAYLELAKNIQPRAPSVRSLEVVLLSRAGAEARARELAEASLAEGVFDYDLLNALFILSWRAKDFPAAERAMALRMEHFPDNRARGFVQLGTMWAKDAGDPVKAVEAFRQALRLAGAQDHASIIERVPPPLRAQVQAADSTPAGTQTSSSNR